MARIGLVFRFQFRHYRLIWLAIPAGQVPIDTDGASAIT
jgi:hypothetical protein